MVTLLIDKKFIEAGIETAQVYVAATNSDERNILSCALAKHVHSEQTNGKGELMTICRVRNPMFLKNINPVNCPNGQGWTMLYIQLTGPLSD